MIIDVGPGYSTPDFRPSLNMDVAYARKFMRMRREAADIEFDAYEFGEDVIVMKGGEWDESYRYAFTKVVQLRYAKDVVGDPLHKAVFHVVFSEEGVVQQVYAYDVDACLIVGSRGRLDA